MQNFEQGPAQPRSIDGKRAGLVAALSALLGGLWLASDEKKDPMRREEVSSHEPRTLKDIGSQKRVSPHRERHESPSQSTNGASEQKENAQDLLGEISVMVKEIFNKRVSDASEDPKKSIEYRSRLTRYCSEQMAATTFIQDSDVLTVRTPGYEEGKIVLLTFAVTDAEHALQAWQDEYARVEKKKNPDTELHMLMYSEPSEEDIRAKMIFLVKNDSMLGLTLYRMDQYQDSALDNAAENAADTLFDICETAVKDSILEDEKGTE